MFIAIAISMAIKFYSGGMTTMSFFSVAVALAVVTQIFRVYTASYLWGRQAVTQPEAEFLTTVGPYAYVRNPLYLGNFLIGIALCLALNEWYAYVSFIVGYIFVYSLVLPYEEMYLEKKFGRLYSEYKSHTGRLIPKLKGYKSGDGVTPDFLAGILGEIHVPLILGLIFLVIYLLFVK